MSELLSRVMSLIEAVNGFMWGTHTFIALLGTGILFTIWSKFIQYRALTHGVQVTRGQYDDKHDPGAINHFQALSAALSGTVGLGNIGGVALAVGIGGPGAVFWMWMTGLLGMAIKAVEVTLAMLYRDTSDPNNPHGGAMYVIDKGFGDRYPAFKPLARVMGVIFCITLLISGFTGGDMFQAWNVADITNQYFGVPPVASGIVMAVVTAMVIIGGIKRIGNFAGRIVPVMCGMYVIAGLVVLVLKSANVPALLLHIVRDAFEPTQAAGAFIGASAWFGLSTGLRRALFSNEAGQGSSPIAHSAAKTNEPVREGIVAGLEPFIDTCLVCTLTALVILSTETWNREAVGSFKADVALTQVDETTWRVDAPVALDNLPELPAPDYWAAGNGFYLVAEIPDNQHGDTASNRVPVAGTIARAAADDPDGAYRAGDLVIEWADVNLDPGDWESPPAELRLLDKGIHRDLIGAALAAHAFDRAIPGLGKWLVTLTAWLFAISTMISWSYYGEQGVVYIMRGTRGVLLYKVVYCLAAVVVTMPGFISSATQLESLADLGTGVMLYANVPIILLMGHQAMRAFRQYFARLDRGEFRPHKPASLLDVAEGRDVE